LQQESAAVRRDGFRDFQDLMARDPQRATRYMAAHQKAQALIAEQQNLQARAQQMQRYQAEMVKAQGDADLVGAHPELANREAIDQARADVMAMFEASGIPRDQVAQLAAANPWLHSGPAQKLLYNMARAYKAQHNISAKRHAVVPPVQRPGASAAYPRITGEQAEMQNLNAMLDGARPSDQARIAAQLKQLQRRGRR
jgi:endonuclease/exonuclease/phosphatase (EEP) superfamily protein YafD